MIHPLADGDRIVVALAERASGPGWLNPLVWYLVRDRNGALRIEAIQPEDQTVPLRVLQATAAKLTAELTAWTRATVPDPHARHNAIVTPDTTGKDTPS